MIPSQYKATNRSSKTSVRFEPSVTVQPINCRATADEKIRGYYSKEELATISFEAKAICVASKKQRQDALSRGQQHQHQQQNYILTDHSLRGFELNLCPTRLQNKIVAQKTILKYQQKLNASTNKTSSEKLLKLGAVSAMMGQWSKQVAANQASLDSLQAYGFGYVIPITETLLQISPFPGTANNIKRGRVTSAACSQVDTSMTIKTFAKRRRISDE